MARQPAPRKSFRHARRLPRRHVLRAIACVVAGALLFAGTGAYALYSELMGNISSDYSVDDFRTTTPTPTPSDTDTPDPTPTDPRAGQEINILLMGTDTRAGENADGTDIEGARADTTILLHIPADRSRVEAVSIPRDLLTDIPSCPMNADGSKTSYEQDMEMFNAAFMTGAWEGDLGLGALCTLLTVEKMTGLTIDDYAVVDFSGFKRVVDTIGGVPMCITEPLKNADAVIDLQPGYQTLNGEQALGFARMRKGRDDGSDIKRIGHQQELLAAIVRQVLSKNLVTDSFQLVQFLDAVTSSLTTSQGLSNPMQLAGLANVLAPIGAEGVTFVTMPTEEYSQNKNRLVASAEAEVLWDRLRNGIPVNSAYEPPASTGATAATATDGTTSAAPDGTAPAEDATADETADTSTTEPTETPTDPWDLKTGLTEPAC
ncbi:LytR family transcriptional attenuator [Salana multivorans]|uniref:LytR family transcriptional attenuator n=1 Tax=Salana multivorans TaxID=120377 RepID=A0A3N2D8I2_9MICO|nr:LCP family protein [Salana multivorans]ROR95764.1 LytR family transcriptional attenuator [Salana multivorans]